MIVWLFLLTVVVSFSFGYMTGKYVVFRGKEIDLLTRRYERTDSSRW